MDSLEYQNRRKKEKKGADDEKEIKRKKKIKKLKVEMCPLPKKNIERKDTVGVYQKKETKRKINTRSLEYTKKRKENCTDATLPLSLLHLLFFWGVRAVDLFIASLDALTLLPKSLLHAVCTG